MKFLIDPRNVNRNPAGRIRAIFTSANVPPRVLIIFLIISVKGKTLSRQIEDRVIFQLIGLQVGASSPKPGQIAAEQQMDFRSSDVLYNTSGTSTFSSSLVSPPSSSWDFACLLPPRVIANTTTHVVLCGYFNKTQADCPRIFPHAGMVTRNSLYSETKVRRTVRISNYTVGKSFLGRRFWKG